MPAPEDVERQVAVAIIVAVEKAAFLMPVDPVIPIPGDGLGLRIPVLLGRG